MTNKIECQHCGEPEMRPVDCYEEGATVWTEYLCDHCGNYEQHARRNDERNI